MGQVSSVLRKTQGGFAHWCPGCEEMHILPSTWTFNGNLERPTFHPSFRHFGLQRVFANGNWTGEWRRDSKGNTIPFVCHYQITDGQIKFCSDSTHSMANWGVALPKIPEGFVDPLF